MPTVNPGRNGNGEQVAHDVNEVFLPAIRRVRRDTEHGAHQLKIASMTLCQGIQAIAFLKGDEQFCMFHDGAEKGKQNVFLGLFLRYLTGEVVKEPVNLPNQYIHWRIEKPIKGAAADGRSALDGRDGNSIGRRALG